MKQKLCDWALILSVPLLVATMVIGLSLANPGEAVAKPGDQCSLPYVTEVVPHGNYFVATIGVVEKPQVVKAYIGKKRVHIDRVGKYTWMLPIKKGKLYTFKAKSAKSGWKAIQFRIARV